MSDALDLLKVPFMNLRCMLQLLIDIKFHLFTTGLSSLSLLTADLLNFLEVLPKLGSAFLLGLFALFLGQIDISLALLLYMPEITIIDLSLSLKSSFPSFLGQSGRRGTRTIQKSLLSVLFGSQKLFINGLFGQRLLFIGAVGL